MSIASIVFALIALALLIVVMSAAARPDTFALKRSLRMQAPRARIFPLINDLRAHATWSPFDKPDPATRKTYRGAAGGQGAVYEWEGRAQTGSGRIEIAQSTPDSRIEMKLHMFKPMKASNTVVFSLHDSDGGTEVTWAMQGNLPFVAKIFHLFCNMDRICGGEFEKGLTNLKGIVEN